jgi:iron-regulated transporter 1
MTTASEDAEHLLRSSTDRSEEDETDSRSSSAQSNLDSQHPLKEYKAQQRTIRKLLYTSHFLSTWNSRLFEFGAFLFLANIFPQTLLPASLYALCRNASAAIAAPWIGSYIDRADRLVVVRISIGTK